MRDIMQNPELQKFSKSVNNTINTVGESVNNYVPIVLDHLALASLLLDRTGKTATCLGALSSSWHLANSNYQDFAVGGSLTAISSRVSNVYVQFGIEAYQLLYDYFGIDFSSEGFDFSKYDIYWSKERDYFRDNFFKIDNTFKLKINDQIMEIPYYEIGF